MRTTTSNASAALSHSDQDAAIRQQGYWSWDEVIAWTRRQLLDFAEQYVHNTGDTTPLNSVHIRAAARRFAIDLESGGALAAQTDRDAMVAAALGEHIVTDGPRDSNEESDLDTVRPDERGLDWDRARRRSELAG